MLSLWSPFDELMRDDEFFGRNFANRRGSSVQPAVDVVEKDDRFVLKAEMPGVKPEEIDVTVDGNVLTLKGERKYEHEDTKEGYRRIERRYGTFQRSFTLPETVNAEQIEADMDHGVLTVHIPKQPAKTPRKVKVRASSLADKAKNLFGKGKSEGEHKPEERAQA